MFLYLKTPVHKRQCQDKIKIQKQSEYTTSEGTPQDHRFLQYPKQRKAFEVVEIHTLL